MFRRVLCVSVVKWFSGFCHHGGTENTENALKQSQTKRFYFFILCSLLETFENECRIRTAKAETIRERVVHKCLARFVRHIIQVAFGVGSVVVNRWWQFPSVDRERGEDLVEVVFDCAGTDEELRALFLNVVARTFFRNRT